SPRARTSSSRHLKAPTRSTRPCRRAAAADSVAVVDPRAVVLDLQVAVRRRPLMVMTQAVPSPAPRLQPPLQRLLLLPFPRLAPLRRRPQVRPHRAQARVPVRHPVAVPAVVAPLLR